MKYFIMILFVLSNTALAMRQPLALCFYRLNYRDNGVSTVLEYKVRGSLDRSASFRINTHRDGKMSEDTIEWTDMFAKESSHYELPSIGSQIEAIKEKLIHTTDIRDKMTLTIVLQRILLPNMRGIESFK